MQKVIIECVDNGFVVIYKDSETTFTKAYEKIGDKNCSTTEKQSITDSMNCLRDVFYDVMDHFGVFNSKHNEYNLNINVEKNG